MTDSFGRRIHYLRVSVTDRCNLRCGYCMPAGGVPSVPHTEVLRYDEITRVVGIMAGLGVDRIRLTGGEPLVRKGIGGLAGEIKRTRGIAFLGLTTNGALLAPMAGDLLRAGVDGLNISLDTLDEVRYKQLTRCGNLQDALDGLHAALDLGFPSVKVNCVLAPQSEKRDWLGVVGLAKALPVDVRLIEWMPMAGEDGPPGVRREEALAAIEETYGPLRPAQGGRGQTPDAGGRTTDGGPARHWLIDGFKGRVGFISAMSHSFCAGCNRLRLTATGELKLCLFYGTGLALKPLLRGGANDETIAAAIQAAVLEKPRQHEGRVLAGGGEIPGNGTGKTGSICTNMDHAGGMAKIGG